MSTIHASPASDPDVPAEPMISGMPALIARVIMISVSRLTAAAENMQVPVARGPGPGSVLPASQPIMRAPSEIALSSESARNPDPSMPVAETSGNDLMATVLDRCCALRISLATQWGNPVGNHVFGKLLSLRRCADRLREEPGKRRLVSLVLYS